VRCVGSPVGKMSKQILIFLAVFGLVYIAHQVDAKPNDPGAKRIRPHDVPVPNLDRYETDDQFEDPMDEVPMDDYYAEEDEPLTQRRRKDPWWSRRRHTHITLNVHTSRHGHYKKKK